MSNTSTSTSASTISYEQVIPALVPALQSSSYIIVLASAFVLWSSRKHLVSIIEKHISLVETLKDNVDKQSETVASNARTIESLTTQNKVLADSVSHCIETKVKVQ